MGDIYAPLGTPKKEARKARDPVAERMERGALSLSMVPRKPWMRWLGVAMVGAGLLGTWLWAKPEAADAGAVAAIDRSSVETPLGPTVDLRTPKPTVAETTGSGEPSPSVVVLQDAPPRVPTLPSVPARKRPAHLPRHELLEDSPHGPLPRTADGLTPFEAYRVPGPVGASRVAIVIGGLGLSQTGTQHAIRELPGTVTLAFSPDGNSLRRWTEAARRDGHELALQVPLAPVGYPEISDSPRTIAADGDIPAQLERSLGRITTYATVMGHGGGAFAPDADAMRDLLAALSARGLGYVDSGEVAASRAVASARGIDLPFAAASVVLDDRADAAAIDRQLDRLVEAARRTGRAVAVGSALPTTVERVGLFAKTAAAKGVTIVPVSNIMRR